MYCYINFWNVESVIPPLHKHPRRFNGHLCILCNGRKKLYPLPHHFVVSFSDLLFLFHLACKRLKQLRTDVLKKWKQHTNPDSPGERPINKMVYTHEKLVSEKPRKNQLQLSAKIFLKFLFSAKTNLSISAA